MQCLVSLCFLSHLISARMQISLYPEKVELSMRDGETCTNFHPGKFLNYHSSTIIFTLICVLPRRNTSTEHQKLWFRHLYLKITILTQILSRVNQTGSTHHCFVYISKQDGDIKCPKNCSDTSNPKQYFKTHCSFRQH